MSIAHRRAKLLARRMGQDALQPAADGCPGCHLAEESSARWVAYFIAEGNAEEEVVRALRASLGPCPRHLRMLAGARGGAEVLARASVDLAREALRLAGRGAELQPCPACARERWAEGHALATLMKKTAAEPAAAPAAFLRFCHPHRLHALSSGLELAWAARMAEAGVQALGSPDGDELAARLCGRDPDAAARAELLRGTAMPPRQGGLRRWVLALLEVDACPACLAEREAARGALEWLTAAAAHEPWELRLCPKHLGTLRAMNADAARRVATALAAEWSAALVRYGAAVAGPFAWGLQRRRARREALAGLLGNRACRACEVARAAGERAGALVLAALRDPELAAAYGRSHGLCFHHVAALPRDARGGPAGQVLGARLALVSWELEEADRKRSWFTRWEEAGSEGTAWRRLPGLLGGAEAGVLDPGAPGPR